MCFWLAQLGHLRLVDHDLRAGWRLVGARPSAVDGGAWAAAGFAAGFAAAAASGDACPAVVEGSGIVAGVWAAVCGAGVCPITGVRGWASRAAAVTRAILARPNW